MATKKILATLAVAITALASAAPVTAATTRTKPRTTVKHYRHFMTSFGVRCAYDSKELGGSISCRNPSSGAGRIGKAGFPAIISRGFYALPRGPILKFNQRWTLGKILSCRIVSSKGVPSIRCLNRTDGFSISRTTVQASTVH